MHSICAVRILLHIREIKRSHDPSSTAGESTSMPSTTLDTGVILDTIDGPGGLMTFTSRSNAPFERGEGSGEGDVVRGPSGSTGIELVPMAHVTQGP